MISATIRRNSAGRIIAFQLQNHGDPLVCACVSFLVQNTANSIEALTDVPFTFEYNPEGGFLQMELENKGQASDSANILLESMALGLRALRESYSDDILVDDIKIEDDIYD